MTDTSSLTSLPHQAFIVSRLPDGLRQAPAEARDRLRQLALDAESARQQLHQASLAVPVLEGFALERLSAELTRLLPGPVDPRHAVLRWVDPAGKRPILQRTLLEAALLNFHERDTQAGAYGAGSGLFAGVTAGGQADLAQPLALSPEAFAKRCRALDIGGRYQQALSEHLPPRLPGRETPVTATPPLAWQVFTAQRRALIADAGLARLTGQLEAEGEALLAHWGLAANEVASVAARAQRLALFGFPLARLMVFSPQTPAAQPQPVVAYIPGDPEGPVAQYPDARSFAIALGARLRQPAFLKFFSGFVPLAQRLAFLERVRAAIAPGGWLPPHVSWTPVPISGDPFVTGYRIWAQQTLAEASALAVPTASLDHRDTFDRYAHWVELGEQLGISLALVVGSALPGINVIVDGIVLAQGVYGVYEGVQAWRQGDAQNALEHLFSAVENAGFFGLGKRPTPAAQDFAAQLVPVTSADGQVRLWHADLEGFSAQSAPPSHVEADPAGLYRYGGRAWVRIVGRFHEVDANTPGTLAQVLHPQRQGYRPALHGDGEGAWLAAHERPADWSGLELMRRFHDRYQSLHDDTLLAAQRLAGISDAQLRAAHLDGSGMPALLAHLLTRRLAEQRMDHTLTGLREGRGLGAVPAPWLDRLRALPGWPAEVAIERHTGAAVEVLGPPLAARRIHLPQQSLSDGTWAARVISHLEPAELDALLGHETSLVPPEHARQVLAERWADVLHASRNALIERLIAPASPADPAHATLARQFPGLAQECIEALLRSATQPERQALTADQMPPAIGEQAAEALRQLRVIRACDALAQGGAGAEREQLVFALFPGVSAWAGQVGLELRSQGVDGPLLRVTAGQAERRWVIVRAGGRYQPFDARGAELGPPASLEQAIFATLPDAVRQAAAPAVVDGGSLRRALYEHALSDRQALRPLLGLVRDNRRFFRPPARRASGAVGYELSGRGRLPATSSSSSDPFRVALRGLYPDVSEAELTELRAGLGGDEQATNALVRLNAELARLRLELDAWVGQAGNSVAENLPAQEVNNRRAVANELIDLWQRREHHLAYGTFGYGANLRSWPVTELPVLSVRFDHVQRLALLDMGLTQVDEPFLRSFPNLTWLDLSMNSLTRIPRLEALPQLRRLSLDYTGRRGADEVLQAVQPIAANMQHLDLASTGLTLSPADLQAFGRLPDLQALDLEDNLITLDEHSAAAFNRLSRLEDLNLNGNPLGRAPTVANLHNLMLLEARGANLSEFPPGLVDLMDREPLRIREINLSHNNIVDLPSFEHTRFIRQLVQGQDNPQSIYYGMSLNLNGNPLSPQAREMLQRAGVSFFADPDEGSSSGDSERETEDQDQWLRGCPDALRALIQQERSNHEAAEFYQLLSRVIATADYRAAPAHTRERTWRLVQTWLQPGEQALPGLSELRQRLFTMARDTMGTCGDGVALTLDDMEFEVQAWHIVANSQVPADGPLLELLAFQRRLWRRALVDEAARRIVRRRAARHHALTEPEAAGTVPPELDPADDLADARLNEGVDEVEVRFYLAQQLEQTLGLPESRTMRYSTRVSAETVRRVAARVLAEDTADAFAAWVAEQPGFRTYLEQAQAQEFAPLRERWHEAANYLYSLGREGEELATWPPMLDGLREALPDVQWPTGTGGRPRFTEQQLRLAYDWVGQRQQRELDALALRLTRRLLGLDAAGGLLGT